jgi:uncharacterized protein YjbI with pentapeptide repeats
MVFDVLDAG